MSLRKPIGHLRWAMDLTKLLTAALGEARFPVNIENLAREISAHRFPSEPLKAVKGGDLPGFEGALYPLGEPRDGWAIIYNEHSISPGRLRFTIAHEFGHYLAHRHLLPDGIECDETAITRRGGKGIEKEADEFAAYLLMPFDDFRARISPSDKPSINELGGCAERYGVSLTAAILRWLEYTDRRAVMVVSRDGGALWAKSSEPAFRSGRFIRTAREAFMIPDQSVASNGKFDDSRQAKAILPAGVWFPEEVEEHSIRSNRYDLTVSILHLQKAIGFMPPEDRLLVDVVEKFESRR